MITKDMIARERKRHFIGENIVVDNVVATKETKIVRKEEVRIIGMYPRFCRVTNGRYDFCVKWEDFLTEEEDDD